MQVPFDVQLHSPFFDQIRDIPTGGYREINDTEKRNSKKADPNKQMDNLLTSKLDVTLKGIFKNKGFEDISDEDYFKLPKLL
jgi:hypothetical protein